MTITDSNATATIVSGVIGAITIIATTIWGPSISRRLNKSKDGDTVQIIGYYQALITKLNKVISGDEHMIDYLKRRNDKMVTKQQQLQEIIDNLEQRKMKAEEHRELIQRRLDPKTVLGSQAALDTPPQNTNK